MLGVRRTSVTEVASNMQAAGVIACSRGAIKILDHAKLLRMSCECYETLLDQSAALARAPDYRRPRLICRAAGFGPRLRRG
jgi:hypothetical protein